MPSTTSKTIPVFCLLVIISYMVPVSACTYMVVDPYYSSSLTILNENQGSFKLLDTGQASSSLNLSEKTVYLDFKDNIASFDPLPISNGSKWNNDLNLPDDWYLDDGGIILREHFLGSSAVVEVYNGTQWLANISIFEENIDFISFYYPLDGFVYVVLDTGNGFALNLTDMQETNFTSTNFWGEFQKQSLPSQNFGLVRVFSNTGNCENYRYYLPSPQGLQLVAIDDVFNTLAIDPKSHSIYIVDLYISNSVTIKEINYLTMEKDSWFFSLQELTPEITSSDTAFFTTYWIPFALLAVPILRKFYRDK